MKKKRLIIEIVCGIVIFGVGYLVGDQMAINRVNRAVTKVTKEISKPTTAKQPTATKKDDTEKAKVYKLGEEGQSGAWSIKVLDAQETNTIAGGDGENKTTQQKFIVVHLQMTDKESAAAEYSPDDFALVNSKTKVQYNVDMEAGEKANQAKTIYAKDDNFFGVYDKINPNLSKQTYVAFEVPKDFNIQDGILGHVGDDKKVVGYNIK